MLRVAFVFAQALVLLAGIYAVTAVPAVAADATVTVVPPARERVVVRPAVRLRGDPAKEYRHAFGCQRVWRCDAQVCEWRRGCWGLYGYMEGPYYSVALAKRQWERDGWPAQDAGPRR